MQRYKDTKYLVYENGDIVNEKTGRSLKPQNNGNGYFKVTLTIGGEQVQKYVHRLVAECHLPNNNIQVNHKDGNKKNNNVSNLEWVTNSENQIHAHRIGLKKNGIDLWNGKFTKEDILKIKELSNSGVKGYIIAKQMGCTKSTISDIINNKRYKNYALTHTEPTQKMRYEMDRIRNRRTQTNY